MQDVTNPAIPVRWEEAYARDAEIFDLDRIPSGVVYRRGWDAAIASQAELVAAALAWYEDSDDPYPCELDLHEAVKKYLMARPA